VSQVVAIPCGDGRALEISVSITVPLGNLSSYTKIVRLCPRYVLVNMLERPIRLWQDSSTLHPSSSDFVESSFIFNHSFESKSASSPYANLLGARFVLIDRDKVMPLGMLAHRSALYVTSVSPSELLPFFLPDTRSERHLRFDFGADWRLTSSIKADVPANYALKLYRALETSHLRHATTRKMKEYIITVPPDSPSSSDFRDRELGVWFESVYGENEIIVKGTKSGKFAYNSNVQVGDQLFCVDDSNIDSLSFEETMKLIKAKLSALSVAEQRNQPKKISILSLQKKPTEIQSESRGCTTNLTLTFRTFEEHLRRERLRNTRDCRSHMPSVEFSLEDIASTSDNSNESPRWEYHDYFGRRGDQY
jgi:hypothetical protein